MSLDVYLRKAEKCPHCSAEYEGELIFDQNITHNLNTMADVAGIYLHVWRPEQIGIARANQLIEPLRTGIAKMEADPETFKKFDSSNGWGLYENFVPWLKRYLAACEENPNAFVQVSR